MEGLDGSRAADAERLKRSVYGLVRAASSVRRGVKIVVGVIGGLGLGAPKSVIATGHRGLTALGMDALNGSYA